MSERHAVAVPLPVLARATVRPPPTGWRRPGVAAIVGGQAWGRAWRAAGHLIAGLPMALTGAVLLLTLAVLGLPMLPVLLWCNRLLTRAQRARFHQCLDVTIPPRHDTFAGETRMTRMLAEARSATTWRQLGYHLVAAATGVAGLAVALAGWAVGLPLACITFFAWTLPEVNAFGWPMRSAGTLLALTAAGLVLCLGARSLLVAVAAADTAAATALLGPSRTERLRHRVVELTQSRAGLVDATDAERRRIERDLHDGAQQRLTALALNLGMLRKRSDDLPEPVRDAIANAHSDAKQALGDLRRLVRGLHPAVLDARGLDAALSGVAASSPVPVKVQVDVPHRLPPTIEAVAYYVVSEALTNVARHAEAGAVQLRVWLEHDRLWVVVADDGRGGASLDAGTGLRGLGQRVSTVDGSLRLDSPAGVGTTITVELPCAS